MLPPKGRSLIQLWLALLVMLCSTSCYAVYTDRRNDAAEPTGDANATDAANAADAFVGGDAVIAGDAAVAVDAGILVDPATGCRPYNVIPTLQAAIPYHGSNGSVEPTCTVDPDGAVKLTYQPLTCGIPAAGWWAGCMFAVGQDLSEFDAVAGRGRGVLAVKTCVDGFVPSALNLRYGSPQFSIAGHTKLLSAIPAEEPFPRAGCRLAFFSPSDACYAFDRCGAGAGCFASGSCDTFERSWLTVMNEFCVPSLDVPSGPTTVTIEQVTYYPLGCTCNRTSDCAPPNVCRHDGWLLSAKCNATPGGCPGVCAP